jgi:plastocyanin
MRYRTGKKRTLLWRSSALAAAMVAAMAAAPVTTYAAQQPSAAVDVLDSGFSPQTSTVDQNGVVTFTIDPADTESHSVTDASGMGLFDSGLLAPGSSYNLTLPAAGTYPIVDSATGNTATVIVPIQVEPDSGPLTTPFNVQWAAAKPPPGYAYDVEISRPGQPFVPWQTGVTTHSAAFVPDAGSGQYKFQARLRNTANGNTSGWSPWVSVTVTFATIPSPIGVVATPSQMLVTDPYCSTSPHQIYSVDTSGNVTLFATLPPIASGDCSEDYIDMSPGLGNFPPGYIYVTQGPQIYQISPDGSQITLFATIPQMAANGHDGITFDRIGSFGYDMIVTSRTGYVFKVDSTGNATEIGRVNSFIEGPAVAPESFGPYGGDILVAGEGHNEVYAVAPNGTVQAIAPFFVAEHVNIVPNTLCTFGNTGAAYVVSDYADNGEVLYNESRLAGLGGDALVTSEDRAGIDVLTPTSTGVTESVFEAAEYNPEGSSMVNCPVPAIGQPVSLKLTTPSSVTAGKPFTMTVSALDKYGQVATNYTGAIHFTSSDGGATLPADYTFQPSDQGTHTFQVTLATPESQSITATDILVNSITGTATVGVAGPATQLKVTAPAAAAPGVPFNVQVTAQDADNLTDGSYTGTVHFTSSDKAATLPPDYTFQSSDNGVHSFPVTLSTLGPHTITVTDTASPAITGSTTVKMPSTATHFSVYGVGSATAGKSFTLKVVARDNHNNIAVGYTGTVSITSSDPQASLPANYTFQPGDNGEHSFPVTLDATGSDTITVTDTASNISGTLTEQVNPATAASLQLAGPDATAVGQPFPLTVTVLDKFGNQVPGYTGTIHFSSTDAAAVLPPDYTFTSADGGTHIFQVTLNTPGVQSVTATDTVNPRITGNLTVTTTSGSDNRMKQRGRSSRAGASGSGGAFPSLNLPAGLVRGGRATQ